MTNRHATRGMPDDEARMTNQMTAGNTALPNAHDGAGAGEGNVISGNFNGVYVYQAKATTVLGNRIGTNAAGTAAAGNVHSGVGIYDSDSNVVGDGTVAGRKRLNTVIGRDKGECRRR